MLLTRDLMTKDVITVKDDAPAFEAAELMVKHAISGLPVTDREYRLLGIITEKDLLTLLTDPDPGSKHVFDFMTRKVICFKDDDNILAVCKFLVENNVRRVPIISHSGKLVGIISRRDILAQVLRIRTHKSH